MKLTPIIRQTIYTIAAIASALIPLLVTLHVFDPAVGSGLLNLIGVLGGIGAGGAATAAVVVGQQRKQGTYAIPSGTPAEQLALAAQNYAQQKTSDLASEQAAHTVLSDVLQIGTALGGAVVTACGDALR